MDQLVFSFIPLVDRILDLAVSDKETCEIQQVAEELRERFVNARSAVQNLSMVDSTLEDLEEQLSRAKEQLQRLNEAEANADTLLKSANKSSKT